MLQLSDLDKKISELEKKLKINQLEKQIKLENNKNSWEKPISAISSIGVFFITLFSVVAYFETLDLESHISSLFGIISASITSYILLLSIGRIKEFSFKGGTLEISAKLNEEMSSIKSEVTQSKREIEGVNKQLEQIQNMVLTSITNKIHVGDVINTAKQKDKETTRRLRELGISEELKKVKLDLNQRRLIDSTINESEAYDHVVKDMTGKSIQTTIDKLLRANYYYSIYDYSRSIKLYQELVKDGFNDSTILNNLGLAQLEFGDIDNAIHTLKEGSKIAPNNSTIQNNLGLCYAYLGKNVKARIFYEKSLKIDPNQARTKTNLAITYRYEGDLKTCEKILEEAYQLDPDEENVLTWKAIIDTEKGNYDDAIKYTNLVLDINTGFLPAISQKGLALVLKGDTDSGMKLLQKVIDIDPSHRHGFYTMAEAYAFLKNRDLTMNYIKKSILQIPSRKRDIRNNPLFDSFKDDLEFQELTQD